MHVEPASGGGAARVRVEVRSAGEGTSLGWVITDPSGHDVAAGVADAGSGTFEAELSEPKQGSRRPYELHVGLWRGGVLCDRRVVSFDVG